MHNVFDGRRCCDLCIMRPCSAPCVRRVFRTFLVTLMPIAMHLMAPSSR